MAKRKVRQDQIGIWVSAGGYITRPISETRFKAGDTVDARHISGCRLATVKIDGNEEMWATTSHDADSHNKLTVEELSSYWERARREALENYGHVYWKGVEKRQAEM